MSTLDKPIRNANGKPSRRSSELTAAAFLVQLGYGLWLVVMFVAAYGLYGLFGIEPGLGTDLSSEGLLGWLVIVLYQVFLPMPNWVGALLARRALREGAGTAAKVALWENLAFGVAFFAFGLVVPF